MAVFGVGGLSLSLNELGVRMEGVSTRVLGWLVTNGLGIVLIAAITTVALKAAGILTSKLMAFLHRDKLDIESQKRAAPLGSFCGGLPAPRSPDRSVCSGTARRPNRRSSPRAVSWAWPSA